MRWRASSVGSAPHLTRSRPVTNLASARILRYDAFEQVVNGLKYRNVDYLTVPRSLLQATDVGHAHPQCRMNPG